MELRGLGPFFLLLAFLQAVPAQADLDERGLSDAPGEILGLSRIEFEYRARREMAAKGDTEAKYQLFVFVQKNRSELNAEMPVAIGFLREAANQGNLDAQFALGLSLLEGDIEESEPKEALSWLEAAASSGHYRARYWAGDGHSRIYKESKNEKDIADAIGHAEYWWLGLVDDPGVPADIALDAQRRLGLLYVRLSQQDTRGWDLLMDAANRGHESSLTSLKDLRKLMQRLVEKGYEEAVPLLDRLDHYFESRHQPAG